MTRVPTTKNSTTQFPDVLQEPQDFGTSRTTKHIIRLHQDRPFHIQPYSFSTEKKKMINDQVEEVLARGITEPTVSVLVMKKDGPVQFYINHRRLNTLNTSEATLMPAIVETLRYLGGANVFSTINLKSAHWQIPVDEVSRYLTAFATPDGATYQSGCTQHVPADYGPESPSRVPPQIHPDLLRQHHRV